jgi:hypothetical protein
MLAGLVIQVISLTIFVIACAEFAYRVRNLPGQWNEKYIHIVTSKLFKAFLIGQ